VIKLLRAIIGKHAVRLSNKRLIVRVRLAMKCLQDRRATKGHSHVIFDEPSSPRTSDSDGDERLGLPVCRVFAEGKSWSVDGVDGRPLYIRGYVRSKEMKGKGGKEPLHAKTDRTTAKKCPSSPRATRASRARTAIRRLGGTGGRTDSRDSSDRWVAAGSRLSAQRAALIQRQKHADCVAGSLRASHGFDHA
jgi:hypothetical protein